MSCGYYVPAIRASFGRVITRDEINNEFQEIERVMACICEQIQNQASTVANTIDLGSHSTSVQIEPSDALLQYLTVEGDVDIELLDPEGFDPRMITLAIADGGSGRFRFTKGLSWTTESHGSSISGKPWKPEQYGGNYGSIVICIHDDIQWLQIVYARNDIDYTAASDADDIYRWKS